MLLKSPRKCVCFELGAVGDNFMIKYLDKSYLEGRPTTERLKLQLAKEEQLLTLDKIGGRLVVFVVWKMFMFCLCSHMITEWCSFMS